MSLKSLLTYSLILLISTLTLNARENPFIPTQSYVDKKAEMVDESYIYEVTSQRDDHMAKAMMKSPKESMMMADNMESEMMLANGRHNILPHIVLNISDETFTIMTKSQLLKKFDLNYKGTKKIVFDFKSSKGFYTKRANLGAYNFKNLIIGAHPMDGFYRIAISVEDIPSNYDVMYEENTIHIMKTQM